MIYCYGGSNDNPEVERYKIIGVVSDFHFKSLRNNIEPLVMHLGQDSRFALFKIQMDNANATIDYLEATRDKFAPGQPFEYQFMNQRCDAMYEAENKVGEIFTVFAVLTIFIASFGLFGLAAFTAEQKTKETGIRKTLAASIPGIVNLLSRNSLKLILISLVMAIPIASFAMSYWLEEFAYRTSLKPTTHIISGVMAIAWITISFQSWKAARINPAQSLKNE